MTDDAPREVDINTLLPAGSTTAPIPDGAVPIDAVLLVKALSPDGKSTWYIRWTEGVGNPELLGALEWMAEAQRHAVWRALDQQAGGNRPTG